jgi:tetratricopeptide (TPR) repeat protein
MNIIIIITILLALIIILIYLARTKLIVLLANAGYMQGNMEKARVLYLKAFELKTRNPMAYLNYARLLLRGGEAAEALRYLELAAKHNKSPFAAKYIDFEVACCHWITGNITEAEATLAKMGERYEYLNYDMLATWGYIHLLLDNHGLAEEASLKALEENPNATAALFNLGLSAYKQGENGKAADFFEKALAVNPELAGCLYYMGRIRDDEDNTKEAQEYYLRAKEAPISIFSPVTAEQINEKIR